MQIQNTADMFANTTQNHFSVKNKTSDYQDVLKFIAIILMFIDHIGLFFFPRLFVLRAIGRAAPFLFLFLAGYNYSIGHKFKRVNIYLGLALTTNWILYGWYLPVNILIAMWLGYFMLSIISLEKDRVNAFLLIALLLVLQPITFQLIEYGTVAVFVMICGYYYKISRSKWLVAAALISLGLVNGIVFPFNRFDYYVFILGYVIVFFLIVSQNFNMTINYNLRAVTKHSAIIYFIHQSLFMAISLLMYS